ncbi:hypothetical protein EV363DRAFT_1398289 [Boletus edulis]|nr:hypothetical protein EV363DRAFT_1398289 [Boletus edulis]
MSVVERSGLDVAVCSRVMTLVEPPPPAPPPRPIGLFVTINMIGTVVVLSVSSWFTTDATSKTSGADATGRAHLDDSDAASDVSLPISLFSSFNLDL